MKNEDIVKINGRNYHKDSGIPVSGNVQPKKQTVASRTSLKSVKMHVNTQKSQTLMRRAVPRPANMKSKIARTMDIAKSAKVSRFAPNPIMKQSVKNIDIIAKPSHNPLISRVNQSMQMIKNSQPAKTLAEIKEEAIKKSIAETKPVSNPKTKKQTKIKKIFKNKYLLVGLFAVFLTIAIYLSYQYLPAISIRIAASQAGINATYPTYTPDGFSIYGPATSEDKKVIIRYKQNNSDKIFTISQSYTNWDSSALHENLVKTWADKSPNTTRVNGLTVYSSTNYENIAWVNRGILFTITGNADLDSRKIERIVSSM